MYTNLFSIVNTTMLPTDNRVSTKTTTGYKAKFNKPDTVAEEIRCIRWLKIGILYNKSQWFWGLDTNNTANWILLASMRGFTRKKCGTSKWLWYEYCQ